MTRPAASAADRGARREVGEALAALGLPVRRIVSLSPVEPAKRGRSTHRVELEDGRTLKARRLESADEARRLCGLQIRACEAFVRPVGHAGRVLLEPWIEGDRLTARDGEARAREAGALLGRLHASLPRGAAVTVATRPWREQAEAELRRLAAGGDLTGAQIARLAERLARSDPGLDRAALVHRDFCPENLLIDRRGCLRVVDNEWLRVDAAGWDLARSFAEWPMTRVAREEFLGGYRSSGPAPVSAEPFWEIVVALWTARVRRAASLRRRAPPLARLRSVAGE